jgi:hypothetical protein
MKLTNNLKMCMIFLAMLGIACLASAPAKAAEPEWWTKQKRDCGLPSSLAYSNWNGQCKSFTGGSPSAPSYDYGAAQRAQEAEAERLRQAEADRLERERLAEEKRAKDAKFILDRDAAAITLKGSSSPAMNQLKGLSATDNFGLKGSGSDAGSTGLKELRGSGPAQHTDTSVVDARNVPTGLPKSIEDSIPHTPAGDRVRKGFQAISEHDWKVALAWFQDALKHEPDSPGLKRLVDLAQFTLQQKSDLAAKPTFAATTVAEKEGGNVPKTGMGEELNRSLNEYYQANPPKHLFKFLKPGGQTQSDTEWLNEKEPMWKKFFRLLTPRFRMKQDGSIIALGIRG